MQKLVTVADTTRALSIGKTKAYQLMAEKRLRSIMIGRRRLILVESIDELIASGNAVEA